MLGISVKERLKKKKAEEDEYMRTSGEPVPNPQDHMNDDSYLKIKIGSFLNNVNLADPNAPRSSFQE